MRKNLNRLYSVCGFAAAFFLASIAMVTIVQIVARQFHVAIETTEVAGFCLAASTFLGLAYTFANGGHVRISLVSQFLPKGAHRIIELWCCSIGIAISGYAAWQMTLFTIQSFDFGDLSPGMVAMPLWIPQSGVAFGLITLTIGIAEQATLIFAGKTAGYEVNVDGTAE
ncbi:TRAP-type C4-dicarboxylate transport system permease small subunit [Yoonia maritima]|uniref:TRAP transporter small permease protein n=1 Tax=Yoonia maritima TaxID=1435347 RepID=A0A2T0VUA8_9RHOB|nr:TRAP transporter small permease [Yoonia maritima]PRY74972.1 TRAP-type C4-dicarboxylate transport system permease small subunit [Yoonia maritima]